MPDGSYQYSMTSVSEAIGKARNSLLDFRGSKRPEALAYKDLTLLEVHYEGHNIPVKAVPVDLAVTYWSYWANKGNAKAQALPYHYHTVLVVVQGVCLHRVGKSVSSTAIANLRSEKHLTLPYYYHMVVLES